jgi:hypothetical protein
MGLFGGSKNEHHETPCKPGGFGWPANQKNPMGWGNDKPRAVKETRPTMHGSRAERRLASGTGGLIKQSGKRVKVTGEKPRGRGKR